MSAGSLRVRLGRIEMARPSLPRYSAEQIDTMDDADLLAALLAGELPAMRHEDWISTLEGTHGELEIEA